MPKFLLTTRRLRPSPAILLIGLSWLTPTWALQPYQADYVFNIDHRFNGESSRTLKKEGADWLYTFNAKISMLANATETSRFRLDSNNNVQSIAHHINYKILVHSKNNNLRFDLSKLQATGSKNGKIVNYAIKPNVLDELNLEFQIREDVKRGKLAPQYWLADEKGQDPVSFVQEGTARIKVPAGTYDTIKIRRLHRDPKRVTTFWLAPQLDYLPIKVTQHDDGTVYDFNLKAYRPAT
jgi:hypothetical protein